MKEQQKYFLEFKNITKRFPGVLALDNISMKIKKGEVHALLGENGAGKSTLMKILAGAYIKDSGEMEMNGQPLTITSPLNAKQQGISVIYQEISLIKQLNAVENIFLGKLKKNRFGLVDWGTMKQEAKVLLDGVNLNIDLMIPVEELSIAQCQMIEIARALLDDAKVIVMDEPTSSLEEREKESLFEIIQDLKEKGITIIYISHKLDEVVSIADSATIIKDGKNVSHITCKEEITKDTIIHDMVGRELGDYYQPHDYERGEMILSVKNLNQGNLVKDVSFEAYRGEILGFAGLIGSGRSETMLALFGASNGTKGEVIFKGRTHLFKKPGDAIKSGIAYAPENRKEQGLVLQSSIADNAIMASYASVLNRVKLISMKKKRDTVNGFIKDLRIATTSQRKEVMELSGGNQQKVVFAKWLNSDAELYIFDEPTRGIDVGSKTEIYKLMRELVVQKKAVIVISSELPEVIGLCDRVIIMHEGIVQGQLMRSELAEEVVMSYAFGQHKTSEPGGA